ncbi:MAG TPA: hypothetical protein VIG92_08275 [Rhodospirillales bacterium]
MRNSRDAGLSLIEATIIVAAMSTLAAILAPTIADYIETSKDVRVNADTELIGAALTRMLTDTGEIAFLMDGNGGGAAFSTNPPSHLTANRVDMLVSDGVTPAIAAGQTRAAGTDWDDALVGAGTGVVQTLRDHLVRNMPSATALNRYRNAADMNIPNNFDPVDGGAFNAEYAWRGAYLQEPVGPDPWGYRYGVNVEFWAKATGVGVGVSGSVNDVFVLSTGRDGVADTPFETLATAGRDGATALGDDVIYVVSGGTR